MQVVLPGVAGALWLVFAGAVLFFSFLAPVPQLSAGMGIFGTISAAIGIFLSIKAYDALTSRPVARERIDPDFDSSDTRAQLVSELPSSGAKVDAWGYAIPPKPKQKMDPDARKGLFILGGMAALGMLVWVGGGASGGRTFSASDYPNAWPYTGYQTADVNCVVRSFGYTRRPVVTVKLGGTVYGLNGAAMGVGGYPDPRVFYPGNPLGDHHETSSKMLRAGLDICGWK